MNKLNKTTYKTEKIKNAELDRLGEPKDRIEVEIGDSKQAEFYPQAKLKRWENEANFSVRLSENETGKQTYKKDKDKVLWSKGNLKAEFYEEGDAFKFVWYLKKKPKTNKVQFSIQSKDVDFFYQPPLTQEEIDKGMVRPDNVVGSYAVYSKSSGRMNRSDGKDYKVGKVGHIYRPHLFDAEGNEAWGDLHIENGIYEVEIPQNFLDNAVYPIKSNDTFGYTGIGASVQWSSANYAYGSGTYTSPSNISGATITKMTMYCGEDYSGDLHAKGFITDTSDNIITNAITGGTLVPIYDNRAWTDFSFSTSPSLSNSTGYYFWTIPDVGSQNFVVYCDSSGATDWSDSSNSYSSPTDPTDKSAHSSERYSIYVTYTPSSTTVGPFPTFFRP